MTKRILSIQNIECETLGMLKPLLLANGYEIQELLAKEHPKQIDPEEYLGIIILGGPMSAYDNLEYLQFEKQLIKSAVGKRIPVLGICLGSQIIASALGGRVYKGNRKEIGWYYVNLTRPAKSGLFKDTARDRLEVFQWHGDTFELPANSEILASSEQYIQAFKIETAIGLQFHIEVTADMIRDWSVQYSMEISQERIDSKDIFHDLESKALILRKNCLIFCSNFCRFIEQCDPAK